MKQNQINPAVNYNVLKQDIFAKDEQITDD
jgi:hypothetical protein